jgi:hypothetical protein
MGSAEAAMESPAAADVDAAGAAAVSSDELLHAARLSAPASATAAMEMVFTVMLPVVDEYSFST